MQLLIPFKAIESEVKMIDEYVVWWTASIKAKRKPEKRKTALEATEWTNETGEDQKYLFDDVEH